ncbi:MAG: hypothetical protein KTR14_10740 [Vampirovibrio sp.]|nr:hypothetical protein [Vampirovibrio sp.]
MIFWAMLSMGIAPDTFGWLMFAGAAYVFGFIDSRMFAKLDKARHHTLPPDMQAEDPQPALAGEMFE